VRVPLTCWHGEGEPAPVVVEPCRIACVADAAKVRVLGSDAQSSMTH